MTIETICGKFRTVCNNPLVLFLKMLQITPSLWGDDLYLRVLYKCMMGKALDLQNPILFSEKLQWLKLFNREVLYTRLVDKHEVKNYVTSKIGGQYINETINIWDSVDSIDFDSLPDQFVLKTTHGGDNCGVYVCSNKKEIDIPSVKAKLKRAMKQDIYALTKEWPYKNVKRRIIAEPYLSDNSDLNKGGLTDYKFYCFDGYVDCVLVCTDRHLNDTKYYFFDKSWTLKRLNFWSKQAPDEFALPKPDKIDEMFEIASNLSKGLPFARIDLYYVNQRIYFGEITFFPYSGLNRKMLPEADAYFGKLLRLPIDKMEK